MLSNNAPNSPPNQKPKRTYSAPVCIVNQIIDTDGERYRYQVGHGIVEGVLKGKVLLNTVFGELEVIPTEPKPLSGASTDKTDSGGGYTIH